MLPAKDVKQLIQHHQQQQQQQQETILIYKSSFRVNSGFNGRQ